MYIFPYVLTCAGLKRALPFASPLWLAVGRLATRAAAGRWSCSVDSSAKPHLCAMSRP